MIRGRIDRHRGIVAIAFTNCETSVAVGDCVTQSVIIVVDATVACPARFRPPVYLDTMTVVDKKPVLADLNGAGVTIKIFGVKPQVGAFTPVAAGSFFERIDAGSNRKHSNVTVDIHLQRGS